MRALLNTLSLRRPAFGLWISSSSGASHARAVVQAAQRAVSFQRQIKNTQSTGLSWLMIDCEHGLTSLVPGVAECIAGVYGAAHHPQTGSSENDVPSVLVRIPAPGMGMGVGNDVGIGASTTWQIKQALDAGALGVLVPMVSTPAQARSVVSAARFPPLGHRGFGNPYTPSIWSHANSKLGPASTTQDFLKTSNEDVQVMIQIETKEGLEQVDELASVDGVDVLFIGPYDLSIALSLPTPSANGDTHPDVEKEIQKIKSVAQSKGKKWYVPKT
jgi:4-hydroxy-2-oxoheptanedioate aldolase